MKTSYVIKINCLNDTRNIIYSLNKNIESDVDIKVERHICDAKSLLSFVAYDLSKPVTLEIHSDDKKEIEKFIDVIRNYIVSD